MWIVMRQIGASRNFLAAAVLGGFAAGAAQAITPCENPVFACAIKDSTKFVQVCEQGGKLHYAFGPADGKAELELVRQRKDVKIEPWNGMGMRYWSNLQIRNGAWTYMLHSSYERGPSEEPPQAGVSIMRDQQVVRELACQPDSIKERIETLLD